MPATAKGARLYLREGKGNRQAVWVIRDGIKFVSTGCAPGDRGAAEQRLAEYIAQKHKPSRNSNRHPSEIAIADVLNIYLDDHGPSVARPKELAQRVMALAGFFGTRTLDQVTGRTCRAYVKHRGSLSAARRELEDLRAAINHHRKEGLCAEVVDVVLPPRAPSRDRWLTRDEAAHLLWTAWRSGQGKRKHVARFILVALYTGTRATAICQAAMRPTVGRGYVDLTEGVFYRRPRRKVETKKRQPPVRLHPRLLAHLRRWAATGKSVAAIVEWNKKPISRMAKGFRHTARDAGFDDVMPHTLRHTSISWAMQNGADRWEASGMYGVTMEVLEKVYGHHRPDQGASVHRAISARKG